ncbi:MAG TPA: aldehyde dehydrogenase family protein [Rhodanobacteraceae bacterium]|nr:aldehyde dehydrogenase family protein [Rhodanobacteraceae bacterium]
MPLGKTDIFERAAQGRLRAPQLIPGFRGNDDGLVNRTPIDDSVIGTLGDGDAVEVDAAVKVARSCFEAGTWRRKSPAERKQAMLAWCDLLDEHAEEIAALDCIDAGKPIDECEATDIPDTIATLRWYAETADKCFGRIAPTGEGATGLIVHEPIGVVGAVLPWNFPAQMYAWKVGPALVTGNSVIVKPAELTPLSAVRMTELAHQAGIPPEALMVVNGRGEQAGEALGRHKDVDMVSFTGSTEVGRRFLKYAAESNLKRIVLECGGKNPQVVFADADLDAAVGDILSAAFWNMSENCSCGSRLLVHENVKDALLEKLHAGLSAWKLGDPRKPGVRLGPMVERAHFEKVKSFLDRARVEGLRCVIGGRVRQDFLSGWYVEPTVYADVGPDSRLFREEIFGPLLTVTAFTDEAEAVGLANDTGYGLAASVYTENMHCARRVAAAIRAGTISVNGFSEGDITTPFGGYKLSGFGGRDNGMEALDQYRETKTIWYVEREA